MFKKEELKILSTLLKIGRNTLIFSFLVGSFANAAPQSGKVTLGQANISTKGSVTNITQSTKKASINWNKFSINKNETVNFKQPNKSSITLNRVTGSERSVINGALNANGQVWILNSNGVLFGKNAKINTAGLLATTKNLTDKDFLAGKYNFKGNSKNSVINLGEIEITDAGYAALLGHKVSNEGSIKAIKGVIKLVGASEYSINLNGNSLVSLKVEKSFIDSLVENKGALIANGGEIYLTTSGAEELLKGTVNNTGVIEANSFEDITGYVELFAHGGEVQVGGSIKAKDGFVETSGKDFSIAKDSSIEAKKWLIDPVDITIDNTLATTVENSLKTGDVTIQTTDNKSSINSSTQSTDTSGDGNIYVNSAIAWGADTTLTLDAYNNIIINEDITINNSEGILKLYYGQGFNSDTNSNYIVNGEIKTDSILSGDNISVNKSGNIIFTNGGLFYRKKGTNGIERLYLFKDRAYVTSKISSTVMYDGVKTTWEHFSQDPEQKDIIISQPKSNTYNIDNVATELKITNESKGIITQDFSNTTNFSVVYEDITLEAGEEVIREWNYTALDYSPFNDASFVSFVNLSNSSDHTSKIYSLNRETLVLGATVEGTGNWGTGDYGSTGWQKVNLKAGEAGTYRLGFVVFNLSDMGLSPYITLTNSSGSTLKNNELFTPIPVDPTGLLGKQGIVIEVPSDIDINYVLGNLTETYKGSEYYLSDYYTNESIFGSEYSDWVLGTDYNFMYDGNLLTSITEAGMYEVYIDILKEGYTEANYGNTNGFFTINTKAITADFSASNKVYDGNINAQISLNSLNGIFGSDSVGISNTAYGMFSDKNAGNDKVVSISGITLSGEDANNYHLVSSTDTATANITKRDINASFVATNKTYDGSSSANVSFNSWDNLVENDVLNASNITASFNDKNAGNDKVVTIDNISLSGEDADNYNLLSSDSTKADINKRDINASFVATNKTYDGSSSANVSFNSWDNLVENDVLNTSSITASFNDKNAGIDKVVTIDNISLTGDDADNYNLVTSNSSSADINKRDINASFVATNKTYDGSSSANVSFNSWDNLVENDDLNASSITASFNDKNAGNDKVVTIDNLSLTGDDADNYNLVTSNSSSADINKRDINASFVTSDKTYDGSSSANVSFNSWDSLVENDDLNTSSITASFNDKNAGNDKVVTIDNISLTGDDADNYNLVTSNSSSADINKRDINASFVTSDKTYDGSSSANVSFNSWDSLVENDDLNTSSITASFNDKNAGNDKVVTIDNISLTGDDADNYNLLSSDSTKADINKRDINASFVTSDKTYDGSSSANVSFNSWDNLVENDDLNASSITASFNDKNAGNDKVVTIDNISLTGEDADNYNLLSSDSTKADINKRDINASFVASNKIYNGETLTELKFSSWDNYLNSDDLSVDNYVGNFVDPYSGNNKDIIVTDTILTGKDKDNYNLVGSTSTKADITENKVEYILASIDNTTSIKTPISNDIKTPIDSLQRKGNNIQREDIVSTPKIASKTKKVTHSEVQSMQGTTETKVPIGENSILTINGSGVNLTSKDTQVEQIFYVTEYINDK
ncbi:YDG domain-containing protein [Psychrilyobacter atlanticus]|uniref:YDG domain-containing protein n=1 Tax=Psychrilyobacter atlanticus TaxID=271091 RepID=UPI0003FDC3E1|nr:YDG domain-containing protein [Psychrilyobacter atlanticus]